jgi:hypothetical protein
LLKNDANYIKTLIEEGILSIRLREKFPGEHGTLNFVCSDGDQFLDVIDQHRELCSGRNCHHMFALNGLPLRVAYDSPVALGCETELYLKEAIVAFQIKNLDTICLLPHWPCGVGVGGNLTFAQQLQLCAEGKTVLRTHFEAEYKGKQPLIVVNVRIDKNPLISELAGVYHFDRHHWANFTQIQQSQEHLDRRKQDSEMEHASA